MREPVKDLGRLQHMLEMSQNLTDAGSKYCLQEIKDDIILFFGLTKMTEIIGEAAYKITNEFKDSHPELPWRQIIGMRHILVHGYFTISPEILWDVIQNDIPQISPILINYIAEFKQ
ncbi:MAG: DUF86 domain-containing protein [Muribaculaceae bacterium]|nr:DUF86 domain-containing protein [Muribaculaceae bacterium]